MSGEPISSDWVESEVPDLTGEQLQAFVDEWHGKASGIFASSSVGSSRAGAKARGVEIFLGLSPASPNSTTSDSMARATQPG